MPKANKKPLVVVTRKLPDSVETRMRELFDARLNLDDKPMTPAELDRLPTLARGAALRFLLTRTYDLINTDANALVKTKDPNEYLRKLRFHQRVKSTREYGLKDA